MYIYFFLSELSNYLLIITNANLFIRDNLVDLVKKRSELEFIINYIYKFKIFKLSFILFFYIY